jgi:phospho-N-acetylmuramoyl-pentapeptide-transferase
VIFFLHRLLPAAFFYVSTRMALALVTSLLICIFLGPRFIKRLYELKIGQPIRMEECPLLGELHGKKKDTPTMGGLLILFSIAVAMLLWMRLSSPLVLPLAFVTFALGLLGALDDRRKFKEKHTRGISSRVKMGVQLLVSVGVVLFMLFADVPGRATLGLLFVPFFKVPITMGLVLGALLVWFVITGASNAANLSDGLDGLASGLIILAAVPLAMLAFLQNNASIAGYLNILYIEGAGEIGVFLAALIGGCLGFLWYNGYPAQVFMGDTGSLSLGGALGVSAVLLRREFLLGIVAAVLVAEALSVILQVGSFRLTGRRIFRIAPLHHHFEYKGWPETKVVLRFWIVALLFAMIGIVSIKLQ